MLCYAVTQPCCALLALTDVHGLTLCKYMQLRVLGRFQLSIIAEHVWSGKHLLLNCGGTVLLCYIVPGSVMSAA